MKPAHVVIAASVRRNAPRPRLTGLQQGGLWLACVLVPLLLAMASTYAHATNGRNERTAATYRAEGLAAFRASAAARAAARAEVRRNRSPLTKRDSGAMKKSDSPIAFIERIQ
jgi:hypothetical protein